jgi:hypothetical protein
MVATTTDEYVLDVTVGMLNKVVLTNTPVMCIELLINLSLRVTWQGDEGIRVFPHFCLAFMHVPDHFDLSQRLP